MPIPYTCTHCGKSDEAPENLAGKRAQCGCGAVIDFSKVKPPPPVLGRFDSFFSSESVADSLLRAMLVFLRVHWLACSITAALLVAVILTVQSVRHTAAEHRAADAFWLRCNAPWVVTIVDGQFTYNARLDIEASNRHVDKATLLLFNKDKELASLRVPPEQIQAYVVNDHLIRINFGVQEKICAGEFQLSFQDDGAIQGSVKGRIRPHFVKGRWSKS
jgi:hypothetical protein